METSSSEAKLDLYSEGSYDDTEPVLAGNISVPGTVGQADGSGTNCKVRDMNIL